MRCVLINPPSLYLANDAAYPPSGLMYLAASLEQAGYEAKIVDLAGDIDWRNAVSKLEADVFGITCVTPNFQTVQEIVDRLPKDAQTIVGGVHPTHCPEDTLANIRCDAIVRGEGELAIVEAMKDLEQGPLRRVYDGGIVPVESIPKPARHLVDLHKYRPGGEDATTIYTSRGCVYNCAFCSRITGQTYRALPIPRVIEEVEEVMELGFRRIVFGDDNIIVQPRRVRELLKALKPLDIEFRLNQDARNVEDDVVALAKEVGCSEISFGVESGNQRMLNLMNKRTTVEANMRAITVTKKHGIKAKAYFVVNFPGEDEESVEETLRFAREALPDKWLVSSFAPLPGCVLPNTHIICSDGVKPIENIGVGTKVLSHNGYQSVKQVLQRHYNGDIITLKPYNLSLSLTLTPEHPVLAIKMQHCSVGGCQEHYCKPTCVQIERQHIQHRDCTKTYISHCKKKSYQDYRLEWIPASDLTTSHAVAYPIITQINDYAIDDAFLKALGFWVAEGHTNGIYMVGVTSKNQDYLMEFDDAIYQQYQIRGKIYPHGTAYRLAISSRKLVTFLRQFGHGAKNKSLPMWLMTLPVERQSIFLSGYAQGDGHARRKQQEYYTSSPSLAHHITQLILRSGVVPSLHYRVRRTNFGIGMEYTVTKSDNGNRNRVWIKNNFAILPLKSVTTARYQGPVYNLEVSETNSYVAESAIVHNCDVFLNPQKYGVTWMSRDWEDYYLVGRDGGFKPCFSTKDLSSERQIYLHDLMYNGLKEILG